MASANARLSEYICPSARTSSATTMVFLAASSFPDEQADRTSVINRRTPINGLICFNMQKSTSFLSHEAVYTARHSLDETLNLQHNQIGSNVAIGTFGLHDQ